MATSAIPAAINALITILDAVEDTDVFDGPPMTGENPDYICIGHDPLDPLNAVEASQVPASLGNRAREESFDILCSLAAWSGGGLISDRRARALDMFAAIEAAVRANVTLNGTVRTAQIGTYTLVQEQTEHGPSAGLRFRIACSARLT